MATFVWVQNDVQALNMDHVVMATHDPEQKMLAVEMAGGDTRIFKGDDAQRLVAWLADNAALPQLLPTGGYFQERAAIRQYRHGHAAGRILCPASRTERSSAES